MLKNVFLCLVKFINQLLSPISVGFYHQYEEFIIWWRSYWKWMPLISTDFRAVHKHILTRFIAVILWFDDVHHDKISLRCDWNVRNNESSTESFINHSSVMKSHYTKCCWNCQQTKRKSPVEPWVRSMNDEKYQNQRNANKMTNWKYLKASFSHTLLRSNCDDDEKYPKEPTCWSWNWQESQICVWVLFIKFLSHKIRIDVFKIGMRSSYQRTC